MFPTLPLLILGCIQPLGRPDSDDDPHDTAPVPEVLVDQDATLPWSGTSEYVDFHIDHAGEPTWIHIMLTSTVVHSLAGILLTPTEGCALSVPYWTAYMEDQEGAHQNQGWVRLVDEGRHTLSVFGEPPEGGGQLHCLVETVPLETDLPFQDADMDCNLGDDACTCTQVCGCGEISTARGSARNPK